MIPKFFAAICYTAVLVGIIAGIVLYYTRVDTEYIEPGTFIEADTCNDCSIEATAAGHFHEECKTHMLALVSYINELGIEMQQHNVPPRVNFSDNACFSEWDGKQVSLIFAQNGTVPIAYAPPNFDLNSALSWTAFGAAAGMFVISSLVIAVLVYSCDRALHRDEYERV